MSEQSAIQTITLNDPQTVAVFVAPAEGETEPRVFFDLSSLVAQFLPAHVSNTLRAVGSGDDLQKMRVLGENDVMQAINNSIDALRNEYRFSL